MPRCIKAIVDTIGTSLLPIRPCLRIAPAPHRSRGISAAAAALVAARRRQPPPPPSSAAAAAVNDDSGGGMGGERWVSVPAAPHRGTKRSFHGSPASTVGSTARGPRPATGWSPRRPSWPTRGACRPPLFSRPDVGARAAPPPLLLPPCPSLPAAVPPASPSAAIPPQPAAVRQRHRRSPRRGRRPRLRARRRLILMQLRGRLWCRCARIPRPSRHLPLSPPALGPRQPPAAVAVNGRRWR